MGCCAAPPICVLSGRWIGARPKPPSASRSRGESDGVGSVLLEHSLLAARNRGIKHLQVCCLVDNRRMQQLARKFEAEIMFDFGTVIGTMENPHPTSPRPQWLEMEADGHGFAAAYVDFQSRLLRPARTLAMALP